jgi:hypothetical protein
MVRHRWISQDGKACLHMLASWFLSRDVAVHSGVVGASAPAPRCFKFRRKTRPGDPGCTTTADATVWQNPCSAAGGLYVVVARPAGRSVDAAPMASPASVSRNVYHAAAAAHALRPSRRQPVGALVHPWPACARMCWNRTVVPSARRAARALLLRSTSALFLRDAHAPVVRDAHNFCSSLRHYARPHDED